jgi:hypothetical protein
LTARGESLFDRNKKKHEGVAQYQTRQYQTEHPPKQQLKTYIHSTIYLSFTSSAKMWQEHTSQDIQIQIYFTKKNTRKHKRKTKETPKNENNNKTKQANHNRWVVLFGMID